MAILTLYNFFTHLILLKCLNFYTSWGGRYCVRYAQWEVVQITLLMKKGRRMFQRRRNRYWGERNVKSSEICKWVNKSNCSSIFYWVGRSLNERNAGGKVWATVLGELKSSVLTLGTVGMRTWNKEIFKEQIFLFGRINLASGWKTGWRRPDGELGTLSQRCDINWANRQWWPQLWGWNLKLNKYTKTVFL